MCSNCGCNTLTQAAESVSDLKLKKDSCCCGATKKTPCICMILGSQCSSVNPMCPCYRLLSVQTKDEKNAEYVAQLTSSQQREIESRLRDALSYLPPEDFEDALENGMDSKIKDLADTIDIEEFFAETFEEKGIQFIPTKCCDDNKLEVLDKKDHVKLVCYGCGDYTKLPKNLLSDSNKRQLIMIQEGFEENEKNEAFHKKYPHGLGRVDVSGLFNAETFEASVVAKKLPKTPVQKAMLNRAMMEQAEIEHTILDLETKARLGLLDEKALMQSLAKKFGAEGAEEIAAYYQDFKEKHPELHETFVLRVANEDSWWGEYNRNKSYKDVQAETAEMLAELGYDFDMIDDYWETIGYDMNPIYETCPDCEGEGIIITRYYPATRDDPADADYVTCEMCDGEGKVLDNPLFDSENEEGSKAFMVAGIAVLSALSFGIYRRFRK